MSAPRDELAAMRGELAELTCNAAERDDDDWMTEAADAILAAGYRKPRTITTAEELDALPVESVVQSYMCVTYEKDVELANPENTWWATTGDDANYLSRHITLPATVLFEPEAQS